MKLNSTNSIYTSHSTIGGYDWCSLVTLNMFIIVNIEDKRTCFAPNCIETYLRRQSNYKKKKKTTTTFLCSQTSND